MLSQVDDATYPLEWVKQLFRQKHWLVTLRAQSSALDLGLDDEDIADCIMKGDRGGIMNCPVCNEGTAKLVERKNYNAQYNGEPVEVPAVEVYHCADCGEDFLNPEQSHALAVAVKNEVRKKLGLLPPERITAIREKAGLTQAELEELLCQGPKVVVRWESGKVIQSGSADTVLRLLEREPELLRALKEIEKQRFAQQRKYTPARSGV